MRVLGIDPGLGGALAILINGRPHDVADMPTVGRVSGKGNQVNAAALSSMIMAFNPDLAVVEMVGARPGEAPSRSFNFGMSVGVIFGVLATLQIPTITPTPSKWQKHAGLIAKDKDVARTKCILVYPHIADKLERKKDVGRAEAILIGAYGVENVKL